MLFELGQHEMIDRIARPVVAVELTVGEGRHLGPLQRSEGPVSVIIDADRLGAQRSIDPRARREDDGREKQQQVVLHYVVRKVANCQADAVS